jgi:flagellar L-ring protein FlgH
MRFLLSPFRWTGRLRLTTVAAGALLLVPTVAQARKKKQKAPAPEVSLQQYIAMAKAGLASPAPTMGSLWTPNGRFSNLARDDKAYRTGDTLTINILEQTTATNSSNVKTARSFSASSGIGAFFGIIPANSGLQNMFSPQSQNALNGQAQTASSSLLNTSLQGMVMAVLPNGYLVVQADRTVKMDNQWQHVILRGLVRPDDVASNNIVSSSAISNLEVEIQGKGVISDGTRPPNKIVRAILRIVGF